MNMEALTKMVVEAWQECQKLISETQHYTRKDQWTSSFKSKEDFTIVVLKHEICAPFLYVIDSSVFEPSSN